MTNLYKDGIRSRDGLVTSAELNNMDSNIMSSVFFICVHDFTGSEAICCFRLVVITDRVVDDHLKATVSEKIRRQTKSKSINE